MKKINYLLYFFLVGALVFACEPAEQEGEEEEGMETDTTATAEDEEAGVSAVFVADTTESVIKWEGSMLKIAGERI